MRKPIWWLAAILILGSAAVLFFSWRANRKAPQVSPPVSTPVVPEPAIHNPVPQPAGTAATPLPSLEASDAPLHDALAEVIGKRSVDDFFKPEMLVRHIVVTIDNLSRKRAAVELRPTKPAPGRFIASGDDQHSTLDPANFQRYAPYVKVLQMLDTKQLAALYFRYYPLFQQAYQDLGYPNGYFNDRLVATIDDLLAAPDQNGPVALVRPNVMYQFADPGLEDLSAGQKLLLRAGPANAAIIKAKLRELRGEIAGHAQARSQP